MVVNKVDLSKFHFFEMDRVVFPGLGKGTVQQICEMQGRPFCWVMFDHKGYSKPHLCAQSELVKAIERRIFLRGTRS